MRRFFPFSIDVSLPGMWRNLAGTALVLALLASLARSTAQDTNLVAQTNELMQADDGSADAVQSGDTGPDDETSTNTVSETNQTATPGPDARTRRIRRRAQNRARALAASSNSKPGSIATNNNGSSLDYSAFRLIVERNIFDPNRAPHSARPAAQPKTVDAFTLVGTLSYEKGIFAFFDGTSGDYKKAVKPEETIAGYKVSSITEDSVKLMQGTNVVELAVGTQMRRREDGTWDRSTTSETYAAASSNSSTAQSSSTGGESDILKKLMMRREKE